MDITPQQVIDVIVAAGINDWVLMGLHGYVGYLPEPRATQDVDVMVSKRLRRKAVTAIRSAWPTLEVVELPEVVRFLDPHDIGTDGHPKPVIDIMTPLAAFQRTILKDFVTVDPQTGHRLPQVEAALVARYAPIVSVGHAREKKEFDAADFRSIVNANIDTIDRDRLHTLADEFFPGAGDEILSFLDLALNDDPFPL